MHVWQIEANRHFGRGYFARLIGTLVEAIFSLQLYKSEANRADPKSGPYMFLTAGHAGPRRVGQWKWHVAAALAVLLAWATTLVSARPGRRFGVAVRAPQK